jgi:hypothetical protein
MPGQCTDYPRAKLESLTDYATTKENFNTSTLIKSIKGIIYRFEDNTYYHLQALHDADIHFYTLHQGKDMTNIKLLELFQMHVAIVGQFVGESARPSNSHQRTKAGRSGLNEHH